MTKEIAGTKQDSIASAPLQRDDLDKSLIHQRWLRRLAATCSGMIFSTLAGAVTPTIHVDFSHDSEVCSAFLAMVKEADVVRMSDEQLCDFRFARLPPLAAKGFTFPMWQPMAVTDAPATYFRLMEANVPAHGPFKMGFPWPDLMAAARVGAKENNLVFSTLQTALQNEGEPLTFVQMDIRQCSKGIYKSVIRKPAYQMQPYAENIGLPFFAVYTQPNMQGAIPVMAAPFGGGQIAFWKKTIPIDLTIFNGWVHVANQPATIILTLNGLKRVPAYGSLDEHVSTYPVCALQIY